MLWVTLEDECSGLLWKMSNELTSCKYFHGDFLRSQFEKLEERLLKRQQPSDGLWQSLFLSLVRVTTLLFERGLRLFAKLNFLMF